METLRICGICGAELPGDSPQGCCAKCLAKTAAATTPAPAEGSPRSTALPLTAPHPDAIRSLFPQLELLGLIGCGGMGAVYRARQRGLDRVVALKILPQQFSKDRGFAERFAREARALARLNHPNIVDVYDLGQAGVIYYFLMEFVDGVNLRQLIESKRLTPQESLGIMSQVCEALEYAHSEGVVHRDIKPENILVDHKGRVKIADFGLSKLLGAEGPAAQLTQPNLRAGHDALHGARAI
jgi:serine/threonine protein kinase